MASPASQTKNIPTKIQEEAEHCHHKPSDSAKVKDLNHKPMKN